jgi:hypothetical protein
MIDVSGIIAKYKGEAVLLDANVLLLLLVGRYDVTLIHPFKRTENFPNEAFPLLVSIVVRFNRIATTPHILAEVSNLAGQLGQPVRTKFFELLSGALTVLDEHHVPCADATAMDCFTRLGLTDAGIARVVQNRFPVLTVDVKLYLHLVARGVDAVNFNHVLDRGWC